MRERKQCFSAQKVMFYDSQSYVLQNDTKGRAPLPSLKGVGRNTNLVTQSGTK